MIRTKERRDGVVGPEGVVVSYGRVKKRIVIITERPRIEQHCSYCVSYCASIDIGVGAVRSLGPGYIHCRACGPVSMDMG